MEFRFPAVIFHDESTVTLKVAGLTLLDRLVVTAHRAGCSPLIVVSKHPVVGLKRTTALGIPIEWQQMPPVLPGRKLMAYTSLLVSSQDIRALLEQPKDSRLNDNLGNPLPIGMISDSVYSLELDVRSVPTIQPQSVARHILNTRDARSAETALWNSLKSGSDGLVDRQLNRPCGRPLSRCLAPTFVSPNAVSIASVLIGLVAACFFATGNHAHAILAAILFQVSAIVDCVDGDIARAVFKESASGKWIDLVGDQVVHIAVFAGIAFGLASRSPQSPALWLGVSAIAGAVLSFAVILRGMFRKSSTPNGRLQKLIDAATNRDFSVLVLILAFANRLEWFLWLTAIGSHAFWISALLIQNLGSQPVSEGRQQ